MFQQIQNGIGTDQSDLDLNSLIMIKLTFPSYLGSNNMPLFLVFSCEIICKLMCIEKYADVNYVGSSVGVPQI